MIDAPSAADEMKIDDQPGYVPSAESEQFRTGINGAVSALRASGIHLDFYESPGTAHEWQTWRRDLHELAPLLFR